ncbi:putative isomerase YbhE [Aspergillus aculeatinus CBS 121060]|uniref:Isomerase YbhE n=1 Tax=Aspergillus aculeatinus CBS 121060 TaxID=1448322 RepID=A0ACD1HGH0_9EURO|nr:putative isomerase YbhE [Aspergillus aculeatinus CBS 121060]RAH72504.1 putative isomerase YbhE [Aspergillus aculeatinus CBS 121060]
MHYKLLLSGDRADFTTLAFDLDKKKLSILANYAAPYNASWVEPVSSQGSVDQLLGLSEGDDAGLLYSFEVDHAHKACKITSQQPTLGAPGHFLTLRDRSALALATYLGGSIALYPISVTKSGTLLLDDVPRTEIIPDFPYRDAGHGPNQGRQRQCHVHQILEDQRGLLYAPDLGSDRVWLLRREGVQKLDICGWLQCPPGTGARHAVLSPDERIMYVIGELSHTVLAFDLSDGPAEAIPPIAGFAPNIIPPEVHPDHQVMMDSSEICLHPSIPNVLYVSNRWERHIARREPHLQNVPQHPPPGDAIAIILLSNDGRSTKAIRHVRTKLDVIRGMRVSDDGRYVVAAGQEGGGVEVYEISGDRGDVWTLVAGLNEGLESGIKHAVWL